MAARLFILHSQWALGDTVCMTALARDLKATYGDRYLVSASGHYRCAWFHNPHITPLPKSGLPAQAQTVKLDYRAGIHNRATLPAHERQHFLTWFHKSFTRQTGVEVPVLKAKGDLHLSGDERNPIVAGPYWVLVAGHKADMSTKQWAIGRYQEVVNRLLDHGIRCVQVGSLARRHVHPRLANVLDLVGKTHERDLFSLIKHSEGVLCGITAAMHIAACFDRPCVVLGGGREDPWWEHYANDGQWPARCSPVKVPHKYLHVIGQLDCCAKVGCWADHTVPEKQDKEARRLRRKSKPKKLCVLPVLAPEIMPKCMEMIPVDEVVRAVLSYQHNADQREIGQTTEARGVSTILALPAAAPLLSIARPPDLARSRAEPPSGAPEPPAPRKLRSEVSVLDHPLLGGKVTVCVLCYGDHYDLTRRCLSGILRTVPERRLDLRIAMNECCSATRAYVRGLPAAVYDHDTNILKGQAMRRLFHDPERPITTPYLLWFDDDSFILRDDWLEAAAQCIIAHHPRGGRLYGIRFVHDLRIYSKHGHRPDLWFKHAAWWRGRNWIGGGGNASKIPFVAGGYLAMASALITEADIPDRRLVHNGIDICLGAQVHQAGYEIIDFNRGKTHIFSSGSPSRGASVPPSAKKRFLWDGLPQ